MELPAIKMMLKGPKNRVIWERNEQNRDPKAYIKESKTLDAHNDKEVVVTLSNWHYTQDKNTTKRTLETMLIPYLVMQLKLKHVVEQDMEDDQFTLVPTSLPNTWKLLVPQAFIANWLCTNLIDLPVKLQDMKASINFKSGYHKLARSDMKTYFAAFAIQDIKEEEEEGSEQGEAAVTVQAPWPPLVEVLGEVATSSGQPSNLHMASSSSEA